MKLLMNESGCYDIISIRRQVCFLSASKNFENVIAWCVSERTFFPAPFNDAAEKRLGNWDFLDVIFCCSYDIHELVAEEELSQILLELNEEHKELLFLCAVRLFSSTRIAKIRGQSDRNIRKVRGTMFKKIRKKLLAAMTDKAEKQQPMTLLEKEFLRECGLKVDNGTEKQYNR